MESLQTTIVLVNAMIKITDRFIFHSYITSFYEDGGCGFARNSLKKYAQRNRFTYNSPT